MTFTKKEITKLIKDIWIALRPLSLSLAVASTTIGILLAYREGAVFKDHVAFDILKIVLITIGGMLVQSSANLMNDFYEGSFKYHRTGEKTYSFLRYKRTAFDLFVFTFSMLCLAATGLIGLILMYIATPKVFMIGIIGMLGAYAYTGEPFVYKRKGLGAFFSLILMGPLMVLGSYVVFTENLSFTPIITALPAGLMIPLLMMSNELRDYHRDKELGIVTLTVKLGFDFGKLIYINLLLTAYVMTGILILKSHLPLFTLLVFLTIPIAFLAYKQVSKPNSSGIRMTNILHISFNLLTILALILSSIL